MDIKFDFENFKSIIFNYFMVFGYVFLKKILIDLKIILKKIWNILQNSPSLPSFYNFTPISQYTLLNAEILKILVEKKSGAQT